MIYPLKKVVNLVDEFTWTYWVDARILERLKRQCRELRANQVSLRAANSSPAATTCIDPRRTIIDER